MRMASTILQRLIIFASAIITLALLITEQYEPLIPLAALVLIALFVTGRNIPLPEPTQDLQEESASTPISPPPPPISSEPGKSRFAQKATVWGLLVILGAGAFLRIYDLKDNPAGLYCDEALVGYNAYSILKTGRDEHGDRFPLYFKGFGTIGGYEPLYIYSAVPFIAIFGLNEFGLRFTSAFYGILTILIAFLLAREMFNWKVGLLASGLLAISPWHIQFSRIAFPQAPLPFFFILGLWLLYRGLSHNKYSICIAAVSFASCFYIYAVARLFVPLFCIGFAVIYAKQLWRMKWVCLLAAAIFMVTAFPIIHKLKSDPNATARWRTLSIVEKGKPPAEIAKVFWRKYRSHYSRSFLFDEGDPNPRHSVRHFGELYKCYMPFIWIGVCFSLLARRQRNLTLLWWLAIFPVAASLTTETPTATRAFVAIPVFELLVGYSLYTIMHIFSMIRWRWIGYPLAAAIFAYFVYNLTPEFKQYLHAYFVDYPIYSARTYYGFQHGYRDSIHYMESQRRNYDQLIITTTNVNQPEILVLFYSKRDPAEYQRTHDLGYVQSVPQILGRYKKGKKALWQLTEPDLRFLDDYEIKKKIVAPDGKISYLIAEVRSQKTFITDWLCLGLFDNTKDACLKKEYIDIHQLDFNADYRGKTSKIRWQPYRPDPEWSTLNLNNHFRSQARENADYASVYLLSYIVSPSQRKAKLQLVGSPDSLSFWLNKEEIAKNFTINSEDECYNFDIQLREGQNELLFKSCENVGDWYLGICVTDLTGHAFKDLSYTTKPEVKPSNATDQQPHETEED